MLRIAYGVRRLNARFVSLSLSLFFVTIAGCQRPPGQPVSAKPNTKHATRNTQDAGRNTQRAPTTHFTDVTREAGINFVHVRATTGQKYFVETMGAGCAFLDYNNDGKLDVFFINGAPLPGFKATAKLTPALYRNNGNRTFTDVTAGAGLAIEFYGMGCCVGDYDNDGDDDLYVSAALGPSRLFRNDGGKFKEVTNQAGVDNGKVFGNSCAWLDYDKDGDLDLFIVNYVKYRSLKDDLPCYFREGVRSYCIPFTYDGESCRLYQNQLKQTGKPTFKDVTKQAGLYNPTGKSLGVAIWDYDDDGWLDLVVANDTEPTFLYHANGDGTFTDVASEKGVAFGENGTAKAGMGIDMSDERNNGKASLVVGNFSGERLAFYRLMDDGFFAEHSVKSGIGEVSLLALTFGVFYFDFDNDGWKDIFVANGHVQDNVELFQNNVSYRQKPFLFRNLHDGKFAEVGIKSGEPFTQLMVLRGAARGDFDDDGRLDVLISENNGPGRLWRNETKSDNHYLRIKLVGVQSNRNGLGAKVKVTTGSLTQMDILRSGSSYCSASELRLHFGLGAASAADKVEITWPSGTVDTYTDVKGDRMITVKEGSSHPE